MAESSRAPTIEMEPCAVASSAEDPAEAFTRGRWLVSSLLAAALATLPLLAGERTLLAPSLIGAALFLFFVVQQDMLRARIPNAVTLPAFGCALVHAAFTGGVAGLTSASLGAGLVFVVLFLPFAARGLGAGDVKALMVLGALWGPASALALLCWSLVFGGVIALVILVSRGGLTEMLRRWGHSIGATLATGTWTYLQPPAGAAARGGLPFGVAIALSVSALERWGVPWAAL